jgi:hypothetical protein
MINFVPNNNGLLEAKQNRYWTNLLETVTDNKFINSSKKQNNGNTNVIGKCKYY